MEPKTRRSALFLKGALVGVGYYVGALVGFALKFPSHSPSALWPPNSILLAALLLLPPRQWWVVFLGAFPVHLFVQLLSGVPVVMSLAFFVSNSSEALIGAFLIRRWLTQPLRFDSLRSAGVFVFAAVVVAPFLSSFLDAGFVTLIGWREESYWRVWRARLPSNALAAFAIVPVIVLWANEGAAWLRRVSTRQRAEGLIMVGGLAAVSALVFAWGDSRRDAAPALLFLPLPFLLWAAVRFGPPATSASLLILIFVSIWGAAKGLGPFGALSPMQNVLSLQMFLLAISVPLIFLAAVIEERRRKEESLRESEQQLRDYAETASDWFWATGPAHEFTYVSEQVRAFGFDESELLGKHRLDIAVDVAAEPQKWREHMATLERHEPFRDFVYQRRRPDGALRIVTASGKPVFDGEGRFAGYRGVARDITELRRAEEMLRDREQRIRDAQLELARVSRVTTLGELAASIAHEINQPLAAIVADANASLNWLAPPDPDVDRVRDSLDAIIKDGHRAGEVIQRIRQLAAKGETQRASVEINSLIREVMPLLRSKFNWITAQIVRRPVRFDMGLVRLTV